MPVASHASPHSRRCSFSTLCTVTLRVIKRSGVVTEWDPGKISAAIAKAFLAVEGPNATGSTRIHDLVEDLTTSVAEALTRRADAARASAHRGHPGPGGAGADARRAPKVARAYVLYREARAEARRAAAIPDPARIRSCMCSTPMTCGCHSIRRHGERDGACLRGLNDVSVDRLLADARRNIYDGIPEHELQIGDDHGRARAHRRRTELLVRRRAAAARRARARGADARAWRRCRR